MTNRKKDATLWAREPNDWYVEPSAVSEAIFKHEIFRYPIVDPWCGMGRVITAAHHAGHRVMGGDIINRIPIANWHPPIVIADFMQRDWPRDIFFDGEFDIVGNPPYGVTNPKGYKWKKHDPEKHPLLVDYVLSRMAQKAALILPGRFIASSASRSVHLERTPLKRVYWLVPRPSMPPGPVIMAGESPGGGEHDFCVCVWERGWPKNSAEHQWMRWSPDKAEDDE